MTSLNGQYILRVQAINPKGGPIVLEYVKPANPSAANGVFLSRATRAEMRRSVYFIFRGDCFEAV